ncbi:hypothetical protein [Carnobacterium divergens]|uniref:hypothetical protein n=1 Tax=Carnobacterium divergens TaxID=2748 RepID=UPI00128E0049|nr:hypothetical protein [Carnobacterium divergens]
MKIKVLSVLMLCGALLTLTACNGGEKASDSQKSKNTSEVQKSKKKKSESSKKESAKKEDSSKESSSATPTEPKSTETNVQEGVKNTLTVDGFWTAMGSDDHITSRWQFFENTLTINSRDVYDTKVSENLDKNGYTVVTITNKNAASHALLVKPSANGMEGITVEGAAYQEYLKNETVPANQVIEFRKGKLEADDFGVPSWNNMDEAIDYYEATFKNQSNESSEELIWENYRRDLWSVVDAETAGNKMTLHFTNISGAGGSYAQFIKGNVTTEIISYDGNASFPNNPTRKDTVRNSDHVIINTEDLWKNQ